MKRRGFLGALLSAAAAPAFVKATSLMPISIASQNASRLIVSEGNIIEYHNVWETDPPVILYGDGIHDDTAALNTYSNGRKVYQYNEFGVLVPVVGLLRNMHFKLSDTIVFDPDINIEAGDIGMINSTVKFTKPLYCGFLIKNPDNKIPLFENVRIFMHSSYNPYYLGCKRST